MISGHARFDSDFTRLTLVNHAKKPQNDDLSLSTLFFRSSSLTGVDEISVSNDDSKRERRKSWNEKKNAFIVKKCLIDRIDHRSAPAT